MTEITITDDAALTTIISTFTVDPARQRELITLLTTGADTWLRHQPGFVSAGIHASLDGTRVVNYAQWQNDEAVQAMRTNPRMAEHTAAVAAIATVEPVRYVVESVCRADLPVPS
jgi:quinol monooxygenase YgiN